MAGTKDKERKIAQDYFVNQGLNAKEAADKVGVTEKTIGAWRSKYNWDKLRDAKHSGNETLQKNLEDLLNKLVEKRLRLLEKDDEESLKEAVSIGDEISKINKAIETNKRDSEPTLRVTIHVIEKFMDELRRQDIKLYHQLLDYQEDYVIKTAQGS